jgi:threonine/homoserine/homoserine lactone efflux protein
MAALAWILAAMLLLAYEFFALATGRKTLSRQMWEWSQAWPLLPWLVGVVMGGLAVHFFWHWCP